jgi:hypothetical protein
MRSLFTLTAALSLTAVAAVGATVPAAEAHDDGTVHVEPHLSGQAQATLAKLRTKLRPLATPEAAVAAEYLPSDDCVAGPDGGMGYHYVNLDIFFANPFDPMNPPMLVYVPTADGGRTLGAAEWAAIDADQDLTTDDDRPSILGVDFDGPMLGHEPGQPIHYDLHAWLFEPNPDGVMSPWNPRVTCP